MKGRFLSKFAKKTVKKTRKAAARKTFGAGAKFLRRGKGGLSFRPGKRGQKKELIKQETLGAQTESKLSFKVGRHDSRARVMKAVGASSYYMKNAQYTLDGVATGIQNVYSFTNTEPFQLQNIGNQCANVTGMSGARQPARFLLENVHHRLVFSNNSTAPARLKLFWIVQKRDTWNGDGGAYSMTYIAPTAESYKWNGSPDDAFDVGLEAESNVAPAATLPSTIPGNTPTMSKLFNDYFTIQREEEIEMATGGVHTVEVNRSFDKVCDASVYSCAPYLGLKGLTQWVMAVSYGSPVRVTSAPYTPGSGPMTTAQVNIGVIEFKEYRYTQVQTAISTLNSADNLQTVTNANTSTINSGSGASGAPGIV